MNPFILFHMAFIKNQWGLENKNDFIFIHLIKYLVNKDQ